MSLIKRKKLLNTLDLAINFVVMVAFLANLILPKIVRAEEGLSGLEYVYPSQIQEVAPVAKKEALARFPESQPRRPDRAVKAVITAYSSTRSQTDDDPFTAASGKKVHDGMIAANWLPFGTKVKIPALYGDKIFVVEDRMNARYGYGRMDVWMDAPIKEVRRFGVQRVVVEVYYD